jgi:opacity protein-like surface antigen
LDYDPKKGFRFSHEGFTTTGNPDYDKTVHEVIEGITDEALLFSNVWNLTTSSSKPHRRERPYLFTKTASGYRVEFRKDDQTAVFFLTDKALLTESIMTLSSKPDDELDLKFSFQETPQGYLMKSISFESKAGAAKGKIDIEYGVIGNFLMPRTVKWECDLSEKNKEKAHSSDSLVLFDYRINGILVNSPVPSAAETKPNIGNFLDFEMSAFPDLFKLGLEFHVGFGPNLSNSPQLNRGYSGYNGTFGLGYELTRNFSLSFDFNGISCRSKNTAATGISLFNDDNLMLLGKYRFLTGNFRPYLFGGTGIGFTNYYTVADLSSGNSAEEIDLAFEAGAGVEYQLAGEIFLFAQGCFLDDLVSPHFAQSAYVDSPTTYVPLQFGITFER